MSGPRVAAVGCLASMTTLSAHVVVVVVVVVVVCCFVMTTSSLDGDDEMGDANLWPRPWDPIDPSSDWT